MPITVSMNDDAGGGALHGTLTLDAVAGVAQFSDLSIDASGVGYTLAVTAGDLDGGLSAPFDITAN